MTGDRPILHLPFDLGLGRNVSPGGRLRLSYRYEYPDYDPAKVDGETDIDALVAEFDLGADFSEFVRIEFEGPVIFRVLEETWLSTATHSGRWEGDLTTFARELVGDDFAEMHSFFFELNEGAKHFQFVTGSACLDVLTRNPPKSSLCLAP